MARLLFQGVFDALLEDQPSIVAVGAGTWLVISIYGTVHIVWFLFRMDRVTGNKKYLFVPYTPTGSSVANPATPDDAVELMGLMIDSVETDMASFGKPVAVSEDAIKTIGVPVAALDELQERVEQMSGVFEEDLDQ